MNRIYQNSSTLSRLLLLWPGKYIRWVNRNKGIESAEQVIYPDEQDSIANILKSLQISQEKKAKESKGVKHEQDGSVQTTGDTGLTLKQLIWMQYKWRLLIGTILMLFGEFIQIAGILTINYLIASINEERVVPDGIWAGIVFIALTIAYALVRNYSVFYLKVVSVQVTKIVSAILYKKILRLSQKSLSLTNSGQLVTIISGELQSLEKDLDYIVYVAIVPITLIVIFSIIAIKFFEASALAFVELFVTLFFFLTLLHKAKNHKGLISMFSDQRNKYVGDMINGIKIIKTYCWEKIYFDKVKDAHDQQCESLKKIIYIYSLGTMIVMSGGLIMTIIIFGYHWGMGRKIDYSSALIVVALATIVSYRQITPMFQGLNVYLGFSVALERTQKVLDMEELDDQKSEQLRQA